MLRTCTVILPQRHLHRTIDGLRVLRCCGYTLILLYCLLYVAFSERSTSGVFLGFWFDSRIRDTAETCFARYLKPHSTQTGLKMPRTRYLFSLKRWTVSRSFCLTLLYCCTIRRTTAVMCSYCSCMSHRWCHGSRSVPLCAWRVNRERQRVWQAAIVTIIFQSPWRLPYPPSEVKPPYRYSYRSACFHDF